MPIKAMVSWERGDAVEWFGHLALGRKCVASPGESATADFVRFTRGNRFGQYSCGNDNASGRSHRCDRVRCFQENEPGAVDGSGGHFRVEGAGALGQAPAAIQVITNDEIRRSGASSLPEALRLADNLEVAQDNAHDWNISARGFNADLSNKLLVLIDGRTVYSPLFSGVFWDVQNVMLEDLDRIEVVSGPGGTLWGANAVNGVINVISKSAQNTQGWYVEGGGGSELRDFGAVRYGGTLAPNVYFRVYGTYFDRNNEVYADGAPAPDAWSEGRGGFSHRYGRPVGR